MFRSEVSAQHAMATRMITGILQHRDMIISLESYCMGTSFEDISYVFKLSGHDNAALGVNSWPILRIRFGSIVSHCIEILEGSHQVQLKSVEECDQIPNRRLLHEKVVRLLVFALTLSCSADLPMELPTLVVWGLSRKMPAKPKSHLLMCLSLLSHSAYETQAADSLWSGFWGVHGYPVWPTPHGRRVEVSYEEHIRNCLENASEEGNDGSDEHETVQQRPFTEELALRCRWSRVDGLCEVPKLLKMCGDAIADGLAYLKSYFPSDTYDKSHKTQGTSDQNSMSSMSAEGRVLVVCACHSLEFLCEVAASAQRDETVDEVRGIAKKLFLTAYQTFKLPGLHTNRESGPTQTITGHSDELVHDVISLWWKLLVVLSRGSFEFSAWLWGHEDLLSAITMSNLSYLRRSTNTDMLAPTLRPLVWSLRLWRVFLSYGNISSLESLETFYYALRVSSCHLTGTNVGIVNDNAFDTNDSLASINFKRLVGNALIEAECPAAMYSGTVLLEMMQLFECACVSLSGVLQIIIAGWASEKHLSTRENYPIQVSRWLSTTHPFIQTAPTKSSNSDTRTIAQLIDVVLKLCSHIIPIISRLATVLDKIPVDNEPGSSEIRLLLASAVNMCSSFIDPANKHSNAIHNIAISSTENRRPFQCSSTDYSSIIHPTNLPVRGSGVLWQLQVLQVCLQESMTAQSGAIPSNALDNDSSSNTIKMIQSRLRSVTRLVTDSTSLTTPSCIIASLLSTLAKTALPNRLLLSPSSCDHSVRNWTNAELSFSYRRLRWAVLHNCIQLQNTTDASDSTFAINLNYFKSVLKASAGTNKPLTITKTSVATGLFSWQIGRLAEADNICQFNIQTQLIDSDTDSTKITNACTDLFAYLKHFPSVSRVLLNFLLTHMSVTARSAGGGDVEDDISTHWPELCALVFKFLGVVAPTISNEPSLTDSAISARSLSTDAIGSMSTFLNVTNGTLLSWVNEPFVRRPDLSDCSWMFRLLLELEHPYFSLWLSLIASRVEDEGSLGSTAVYKNPSLALYILLLITTPEHAYRWTEQPTDRFDIKCTWAYTEVDETTTISFMQLMLQSLRTLFNDDHQSATILAAESRLHIPAPSGDTFGTSNEKNISKFIETVFKESPPTNLRRAERQKHLSKDVNTNVSESNASISARLEVALLELSDRVLDSGINQFLPAEVHAVVMSALVYPSMPWRVQECVWLGLAEHNLAHLIDIDATIYDTEANLIETRLKKSLSDLLYPLTTKKSSQQLSLHPNVISKIKRILATLRRPEDAELRVFRYLRHQLSAND